MEHDDLSFVNDLVPEISPGDAPRTDRVTAFDPSTARAIGNLPLTDSEAYGRVVQEATESFHRWRSIPAPRRGEWVRRIGEVLRREKSRLARLVSLECGKVLSEGEGEVQEMIDMADFCVGLSRQLYGLTMHSERPNHRMYEQWHPLGPIGVITAFNFPVAVWAWNAFVGAVCGDTVVWKPSERTPLCAAAVQNLVDEASRDSDFPRVSFVVQGGRELGEALAADPRLPLVSATGSCRMGRSLAPVVAARMGRCLLELGGNNAAILMDDVDQELALRAVVFSAVGTAGQRCTTLRRVFIQRGIADEFTSRLVKVYQTLPSRIGSPLDASTLVGPLIDENAAAAFEAAMVRIAAEGGDVLCGGRRAEAERLPESLRRGHFVEPTLVRARSDMPIVREETFAPILYITPFDTLDEAIALQNGVEQGLSSSIFTSSITGAERFLGPEGSDCGIANVNIGTSGAEIGGAFGGEKHTGGGREAGSDAWKAYMRRQTCTINLSNDLPLAQGVRFDV